MTSLSERPVDIGMDEALIMDGFDDCAVGYLQRFGNEPVIIYDRELVIKKLMELAPEGTREDAVEYYEFNQLGGWHGDLTPGFLVRIPDDES